MPLLLPQILTRARRRRGAEGMEAEPEALGVIARHATGALRDGLSLLEQVASGGMNVLNFFAEIHRIQDVFLQNAANLLPIFGIGLCGCVGVPH